MIINAFKLKSDEELLGAYKQFLKSIDCAIILYANGILTDAEYDECRKKILKKYKDNCVESIDELKNIVVKTYRTRKQAESGCSSWDRDFEVVECKEIIDIKE